MILQRNPTSVRTVPRTAEASNTVITDIFSREIQNAANGVSVSDAPLTDDRTGSSSNIGPAQKTLTTENRTCSPNHMAKFRITPTTAAVLAAMPIKTAALPRNRSMKGAPRPIHSQLACSR